MVRISRTTVLCVALVTNVGAPWLQHWHATDCCGHAPRPARCWPRHTATGHDHSHDHSHDYRQDDSAAGVASVAGGNEDAQSRVGNPLVLAPRDCSSAHDLRSCAICRHYSQGQWHVVARSPSGVSLRREMVASRPSTRIVRSFDAFAARAPPGA